MTDSKPRIVYKQQRRPIPWYMALLILLILASFAFGVWLWQSGWMELEAPPATPNYDSTPVP